MLYEMKPQTQAETIAMLYYTRSYYTLICLLFLCLCVVHAMTFHVNDEAKNNGGSIAAVRFQRRMTFNNGALCKNSFLQTDVSLAIATTAPPHTTPITRTIEDY